MRLQNDPDAKAFGEWLSHSHIGHSQNSDENSEIEIPQDMHSPDIQSLMKFIYPHIDSFPPPPDYFLK